jgi:hypothetical protein
MKTQITQTTAPKPAQSDLELSNFERMLRRMKEVVVPSPHFSAEVGALQDLLTSQLPSERRRVSFGTDFGAGPPPLMNA